jgi:hypothetical protein
MLRRSFLQAMGIAAAGLGVKVAKAAPALVPLPDPVPIKDWLDPCSQHKARMAVFTNPRLRLMMLKFCKPIDHYWGQLVWIYKRNPTAIDSLRRYWGLDASKSWLQRAYNLDLQWLAGGDRPSFNHETYARDCEGSRRGRLRDAWQAKNPYGVVPKALQHNYPDLV